jgi:hypothetical protein
MRHIDFAFKVVIAFKAEEFLSVRENLINCVLHFFSLTDFHQKCGDAFLFTGAEILPVPAVDFHDALHRAAAPLELCYGFDEAGKSGAYGKLSNAGSVAVGNNLGDVGVPNNLTVIRQVVSGLKAVKVCLAECAVEVEFLPACAAIILNGFIDYCDVVFHA